MSRNPVSHFTTVRIEQGALLFYEQHLERLLLDSRICSTDQKQVQKAMITAQKLAVKEKRATLKIVVHATGFDLDVQPLRREYWRDEKNLALELDFFQDPRTEIALQAKVLDRNDYRLVPANAVFTDEGKVREGPHFHVAFLFGKAWHTPLREKGVLYGTQRAILLEQRNWRERVILKSEVPDAAACVAFSAHLGMAEVARFGGVHFATQARF